MKRLVTFIIILIIPNILLFILWVITARNFPAMEVMSSDFWMSFMTIYTFIDMFISLGLNEKDIDSINNIFRP